jgi:multidrug efflux system membrane fusion protein
MPVQVYGRSGQEVLATGTVSALDNQIDTTTGTVRLKAVFENEDNALFPNQFVNVRLLVEVQHDALLIPLSAVQISNQARYVFVVNKEDQTVSQRTIVTGKSEDGLIAVSEGLSAGEVVVTDGLDKLQDGAKVLARESKPGEKGPGGKGPGEKRKKKPAATKDS